MSNKIDYDLLARPKQTSSQSKHADRLSPVEFRQTVWTRDGGRDRATGQPLSKTDPDYDRIGNVCHLRSKGAHADLALDPDNAVLMSYTNHVLSDARGGRLLRLTDPATGEPATDGSKAIRFTLYDRSGKMRWTRVSGGQR